MSVGCRFSSLREIQLKEKMSSPVYCYLFCLLVVLSFSACLCTKDPDCPFGSPKIDLEDPDGRCDRFWLCEDGMTSDMFCPSGKGFNPATKKCDDKAPCLSDPSAAASERPAGLARIADILVTKSMPSPTDGSDKKLNGLATLSSLFTPLILPLVRMVAG
ncbi:uncharacterized protein LOC130693332 isoform X1 [Daphnia carinata]|uniref:uncharacterized protein LOC130693332 isoform X1 n=1 Tax=Daphnia carinata TaxID=120202 RepID=UPI0028697267|nr:uncharacterized protein LOC130693332 isoform X1 [Daphnia carinata]